MDIRVDNGDAICRKARSSKTLVWNESVEVQLEKAHEIEFVVRGADFRQFAVLFFRLCDIETEIREQQAADMVGSKFVHQIFCPLLILHHAPHRTMLTLSRVSGIWSLQDRSKWASDLVWRQGISDAHNSSSIHHPTTQ